MANGNISAFTRDAQKVLLGLVCKSSPDFDISL